MQLNLTKKPKGVTIIEGFPGFGLIGTITTEFLIDQLKAELIGTIKFEDIPTMVAIHEGKVVNPIGVFYDKKTNIIIIHVITSIANIEWKLADAIMQIADQLQAKEIIGLEGVAAPEETEESKCFYFSNREQIRGKFTSIKIDQLKEGIIVGVTGAMILSDHVPISCVFAETHSGLPDSKAAAAIIQVLDKYLGLNLDPKPLLEQAKKFEEKIQGIVEQGKEAKDMQMKKKLSYVG